MSILVGLDHTDDTPDDDKETDIFVFGYSCRIYHDDETALAEDQGAYLIPWMGERTLLIDRYDGRAHFSDKTQFCIKSNIVQRMTEEEEEFEALLDEERYMALDKDILEEDLLKEEEEKRLQERVMPNGYYNAVEYQYKSSPSQDNSPKPPPAPPMSSVLIDRENLGDDGAFTPPPNLVIPEDMVTPSTNKVHVIIEKTASFVVDKGPQMEIIIKLKQKHNPYFAFLNVDDHLNPYYRLLLKAIINGVYTPKVLEHATTVGSSESSATQSESCEAAVTPLISRSVKHLQSEEESEDDDGELHPLLRASLPEPGQLKPSKELSADTAEVHPLQAQADNPMVPSTNIEYYMDSWSKYWTQYYASCNQMSTTPQSQSYDYEAYYAQYQQYYSSMHGGQNTTDQPGNSHHPYKEMLAKLPQSVLEQPAKPPPPNIQTIVDKMAEYVAKNGDAFERTVIERNASDPRFDFLKPGNEFHVYYTTVKLIQISKLKESEKHDQAAEKIHSLKPDGKVGFSLTASKPLQASKVDLKELSDSDDESSDVPNTVPSSHQSPLTTDDTVQDTTAPQTMESLEEREKQMERRRKAAIFIEELKKKRMKRLAEKGANEEDEDFIGPKKQKC